MPATYEAIASQTLGSSASSVTFSSIPGTFTDLILVVMAKRNTSTAGAADLSITFNSDTGSNYSATLLYGSSPPASTRASSQTSMPYTGIAGDGAWSDIPASIIHVMSYANTNVYKTVLSAYGATSLYAARGVGLWRSTAAITSLTMTPANSFASGATFSLYGIKAA